MSKAVNRPAKILTNEELMAIRREDPLRIELISERLDCKLKRLNLVQNKKLRKNIQIDTDKLIAGGQDD